MYIIQPFTAHPADITNKYPIKVTQLMTYAAGSLEALNLDYVVIGLAI